MMVVVAFSCTQWKTSSSLAAADAIIYIINYYVFSQQCISYVLWLFYCYVLCMKQETNISIFIMRNKNNIRNGVAKKSLKLE